MKKAPGKPGAFAFTVAHSFYPHLFKFLFTILFTVLFTVLFTLLFTQS